MRALAGDLPADAATIQRLKRTEFHSLGLVLGYSYAGSPVIQRYGFRTAQDPAAGNGMLPDGTTYSPVAEPGARLPHAWQPDGSSLYDHLGSGFTLVGPVASWPDGVARLVRQATERGLPLTLCEPPADYPWRDEFLLVRPDQHIAWRDSDCDRIDLDVVTGRAMSSAVGTSMTGTGSVRG